MLVPFHQLPSNAHIWVYQSEKELTEKEKKLIESKLETFCQNWDSHGTPLKSSFQILHNRFIILGVDESMSGASGCSIDKSVAVMSEINQQFGLNLLDKGKVAFRDQNGIDLFDFRKAGDLIKEGKLKRETPVFNNSVQTVQDLATAWEVPALETWLKRYFA